MMDFYSAASRTFQDNLERIEKQGRKDSPEWRLANGLLHLTRGLQQAREEEEELRRSFARSWRPRERAKSFGVAETWGERWRRSKSFAPLSILMAWPALKLIPPATGVTVAPASAAALIVVSPDADRHGHSSLEVRARVDPNRPRSAAQSVRQRGQLRPLPWRQLLVSS